MHSSILALCLAPVALASVLPRADNGNWTITYSDNDYNYGYHSKGIIVAYNNPSLADPVPAACNWVKSPAKGVSDGCSPSGFSYTLSGNSEEAGKHTLALQQDVELNGKKVTVKGEGEVEISCETDDEKTVCKADGTIVASN